VSQSTRERLKKILIEQSLLKGDFLLASGQRSSFYLDVRRTSLHPEGAALCAELFLEALSDLDVASVGGPVLGAAPLVGSLASESFRRGRPLPTFLVRREPKGHGTAKLLEGHFAPGSQVALIEDVVTTGSSLLRALAVVRGEGAIVPRVVSVVDREQGGAEAFAENQVEYRWLFKASELMED